MNKAYIICCNDSNEYVVLDDEKKADKVLQELKDDDYKQKRLKLQSSYQTNKTIGFEEYSRLYYWHIHEVPYE